MLPASWEEYLAKLEREQGKTETPTKRHQPRIKRHQSARMRRVSTQTSNLVRAAYTTESDFNQTPVSTDESKLVRALPAYDWTPSKNTRSRR